MKINIVIAAIIFGSKLVIASEVSSWTDVLEDPIFVRLMTFATKRRLDIVSPIQCLEEYAPNLQGFLKRIAFPVRILSGSEACAPDGNCHSISLQASSLLLILCEHDHMSKILVRLPYKYFAVLLSDEVRDDVLSLENPGSFRDPNYEHLLYRGVCIIFRNDSAIMLAKDSQVECISCDGIPLRENWYPRLLGQLPLHGAQLSLHCLYPDLCGHPAHAELLQVFTHKNASFQQKQYNALEFNSMFFNANRTDHINDVMFWIRKNPVWNLGFPMKVRPHYYHSVAFTLFGKRRYPLAKEIVIILPFSSHVWIALLCGVMLSAFALFLTLCASQGGISSAHGVVFALVASLLQQSDQLSYEQRRHFSPKLLLALWSIMGLVLATGYKGLLTALLRDVPLEAEHPKFPNRSSTYTQGCILHHLELRELRSETPKESVARIIDTEYLHIRKRYTISDKRFFLMVNQFMGQHTSAIHRGLQKFDYIPTGDLLFSQIVGAQILYASPFRKALSDTISQAQEAGLFTRAEDLEEFEVQYRSHSIGVSSAPEVLRVGDIKPFLVYWSVGLGAAVLVLLLESAAAFLRFCVKRRPFRWEIQRVDLYLRWAY